MNGKFIASNWLFRDFLSHHSGEWERKSSNMGNGYQKFPHFSGDWADFTEWICTLKIKIFCIGLGILWDSGWPWKEIINKSEIFVVHVSRTLSKQQIEIFNHYKVLSANCKRTDCLFCIVVIHRDMSIR